MSRTVTVGISDLNVVKAPDVLVTYALGSCVGICLYDPVSKVAGLSHIMLQMFGATSSAAINNIGQRNVQAVKAALMGLHIPIIAEDCGKNYGRTQFFYSEDGTMRIKSATKGEWTF